MLQIDVKADLVVLDLSTGTRTTYAQRIAYYPAYQRDMEEVVDYRQMSRLAQDPAAVRAEAKRIRVVLGATATGTELDFLTKLEKFKGPEPITMRQREFLYALQQRISRRQMMHGFRAHTLIEKLWFRRDDLSENAEEFLQDMRKFGASVAPSTNQWRYIFALCHQTHIVEDYVNVQ